MDTTKETRRIKTTNINSLLGAAIVLAVVIWALREWTGNIPIWAFVFPYTLLGICIVCLVADLIHLRSKGKLLQQIRARIDMLRCDDIK